MAEFLLLLLGIVCMLYFAAIALYAGLSSKFPVLWILLGVGFWAGGAALHFRIQVPQILLEGILYSLCLLFGLFLFVEAKIVKAMFQKEEKRLECLIVLGAQVKGTHPRSVFGIPDSQSRGISETKSRNKSHSFRRQG